MIECHVFNSFTRQDLRTQGAYVLSQFVGGMAGVLFLFLAGVTFAFQMERLEQRAQPFRARLAARQVGRQKIRVTRGPYTASAGIRFPRSTPKPSARSSLSFRSTPPP